MNAEHFNDGSEKSKSGAQASTRIVDKACNALRGAIQKYGPQFAKQRLWNQEFSNGRWRCLESSGDERVHIQIENYSQKGAVLDLGCGPGTTGLELSSDSYEIYTGVDISDVAVQKAHSRAIAAGRASQNEYLQSDIISFVPSRKYNVIFLGDSIYYISPRSLVPLLHRYSGYLTADGVFIVRMFDVSGKHRYILEMIEETFRVKGKWTSSDRSCLIVFSSTGIGVAGK
jgi:trans-aconitate methyltransferase